MAKIVKVFDINFLEHWVKSFNRSFLQICIENTHRIEPLAAGIENNSLKFG